MNSDAYADFTAAALARIAAALKALGVASAGPRKESAESREASDSRRFTIGFVGIVNRGVSTVINALLGQEVLPTDILPCTAVPVRVTYGAEPRAELRMRDGSVRRIQVEELTDYVTKLTRENESRAADVDEAVVFYPCQLCQDGVDIVDTPGLNDDERMNRISEEIIPKLDAVIMVIVPGCPFSMSESEFFRSKLIRFVPDRLIFLLNKIDTLRRADILPRIVETIKAIIQEAARKELAVWYGEDSRQYQDAQMKLDGIRIFPISALDALEGKQSGDREMIERGGMEPFKAALTEMYGACKPV